MNWRPVEYQPRLKSIFFEIYQDFKVAVRSIPYVILALDTDDHEQYDMKIALDIRSVNFTPKEQSDLWAELRDCAAVLPRQGAVKVRNRKKNG